MQAHYSGNSWGEQRGGERQVAGEGGEGGGGEKLFREQVESSGMKLRKGYCNLNG